MRENPIKAGLKQWVLSVACALAACLPLASHAEPYFPSKDGSMILDKATNLVWQRCSVGQNWNGETCPGKANTYKFSNAQHQAGNGWRLPTVRELASLIRCSSGQTRANADPEDGGSSIANACDGVYASPTIDIVAFPATLAGSYWSSSPNVGGSDLAWVVDFDGGYVGYNNRFNDLAVRLVRASQISGSEAALEFPHSIDEVLRIAEAKRQEAQRIADAKRQEEQRIAGAKRQEEERRAKEEERRAKAQRAAAERSLVAGGAQALYLNAGKAQRSGSVTVGGVNFGASELYEMIIEKFPKSEYAVKATDQLTAMDRTETQSRAVRNAAEAQRQADQNASNRAQCFSQVRTCEANCRSWTTDSYATIQSCVARCQQNCN